MTIVSEDSPYCGRSVRVKRIFWRERRPWVLVRFGIGGMTAVPWDWTDLPVPGLESSALPTGTPALLSSSALRDLVHFLRNRGAKPNKGPALD